MACGEQKMFKEYHKIETPYIRAEDGSKKLIEGVFRNPWVEQCKDLIWVFTEKVDGTNIRVYWDGHKFTLGGRTEKSNIPSKLVEWFNTTFCNNEMEELFEQKFGDKEVILFGEGYGAGIQAVGKEYLADTNDFIMFDAMVNGQYVNNEDSMQIAESLGLKHAPVIYTGTIENCVDLIKTNPQSRLGSCTMEGVVGRLPLNMYDGRGNRMIVKIKCRDFEKSS